MYIAYIYIYVYSIYIYILYVQVALADGVVYLYALADGEME